MIDLSFLQPSLFDTRTYSESVTTQWLAANLTPPRVQTEAYIVFALFVAVLLLGLWVTWCTFAIRRIRKQHTDWYEIRAPNIQTRLAELGMDVQRINIHPTVELAAEITALKLQVEAILSHQQRKAKSVTKILDRGKRK